MNESILRKIKRCMELSNSSNENEAAIALKQMNKLMREHGITEKHVMASEIIEHNIDSGLRKRIPAWVLHLHQTVAQAFDCESLVRTYNYLYNAQLIFLGEKTLVEIAEYAFSVLYRQLKAKRKEFIKNELSRYRKNGNKTKMADAYCEAWASAVRQKCENISPNRELKAKIQAYKETTYDEVGEYKNHSKIDYRDEKICKAIALGFSDAADVNLYTATEHSPVSLIG